MATTSTATSAAQGPTRCGRPAGRDYRAALDLLGDCARVTNRADFLRVVLPGLRQVLHADEVSYAVVALDPMRVVEGGAFPTPMKDVPLAAYTFLSKPALHPVIAHFGARRDPRAVRLSELMPRSELVRSLYYADFYQPRGISFSNGIAITLDRQRLTALGVGRDSRDFSTGEQKLFESLRVPISGLWGRIMERENWARMLADLPALSPELRSESLTEGQNRVVGLLLRGMSNQAIASALGVSTKAVEQHLTNVYRHYGVRSRSQLVLRLSHPAPAHGS